MTFYSHRALKRQPEKTERGQKQLSGLNRSTAADPEIIRLDTFNFILVQVKKDFGTATA